MQKDGKPVLIIDSVKGITNITFWDMIELLYDIGIIEIDDDGFRIMRVRDDI